MALIDDIIAEVQAVPVASGGSMTLARTDFTSDFVHDFFDNVVEAPQIIVTNTPGPSVSTGSVTVSGTADFAGYAGTTVTIAFAADDDGNVTITVTAKLAADAPVTLPVVTWIALSGPTLVATYAQPYGIGTLAFQADIVLQGETSGSIPIEVVAEAGSVWQLDVAEGGNGVTPEQLVALIGGSALTDLLPSELVSILEGITIAGLSVRFDTAQKTVDYLSTGIEVTNGWTIVPKFLVLEPGLQILLTITNVTDAIHRDVVVVVKAKLDIGGVQTPLFLQADFGGAGTSWIAGLDPDTAGVTIPSLTDLISAAGGADLVPALPGGLKDLPGIQLSTLELDFTLSPAAVQRFSFAASTSSAWTVVEGFLVIEQLELSLQLLDPGGQGRTGAEIGGIFCITSDVWLFFVVDKPVDSSDWTLTGGLAPGHTFALRDLVASLLKEFVAVPPAVPSLTFDTAQATVVPGKSMTFTAGSKSPWPLIDGKLELDSFDLTFTYASGGARPFTGSLATKLTVAGVDVAIQAGLDASGAWTFDGKTGTGDVVQVGVLIDDLANRFGVTALPHDALKSLTLQDLEVRFSSGGSAGPPAAFHLSGTGSLTVAGTDLSATMAIDLTHGPSGYAGAFAGTVQVARGNAAAETFSFSLDSTGAMKSHWSAATPDDGLSLTEVAGAFGFEVPSGIPPQLDPTLTDVVLDYDFSKSALLLQLKTASGGGVVVVSAMSDGATPVRMWAFGLDLHLGITLGDLPLVGDKLGDAQQLGISTLGLWVTSDPPLKTADAKKLNTVFGGFTPAVPEEDATSRVSAFGQLSLGAETFPLQLSLGSDDSQVAATPAPAGPAPATAAPATAAPAPAGGAMKWIDLQRQIGVVQFKRIGVGYSGGQLTFALDVAMTMGPLSISLDGLGITSSLDSFDPSFHLDGLGLAYSEGPVTISGALLRLPGEELAPGTEWQFDGTVVITAGTLSLAAIGSYAQLSSGQPSLFVFAQVDEPLGGPPAAFVTGLMAGVGFNRSLTIPAQDEVTAFPLLALNQPPPPGKPRPAAGDVFGVLEGRTAGPGGDKRAWIAPQPGSYWLAVGVEFTSFEIVTTRALLIAEDDEGFQLSLLGLSTMQLPRPEDPGPTYAYVQLQLLAVFRPDEGYFGLTAILAPTSYVIDPSCHLHGGFAFFVWFDPNPHAGQFVLTLGGYHPAFPVPDYFPKVPRLGFDWAVGDTVSISGDAYFALTTTCVMLGGELQVLFHDGDLRAWLTAQTDVLVSWNPFFYVVDVDISIGVSYRLNLHFTHTTISLSVGASLHLWGPPTAGTVTVHLWCVSFTVAFGSGSSDAATEPLPWASTTGADFKGLLPGTPDVVKVTAVAGLAGTLPADPGGSAKWVVRARDFRFATQAAVPATHLRYGDTPADQPGTPGVDYTADDGLCIRPMDKSGLTSVHCLTVRQGSPDADPVDPSGWTLVPWTQNVPDALWGEPPSPFSHVPAAPGADVVEDQMVGYAVAAPRPRAGAAPGVVELSTIAEEELAPGTLPLDPAATGSGRYLAQLSETTIGAIQTIGSEAVQTGRSALFTALSDAGVYTGPNDSMSGLGAAAETSFADSPMEPVAQVASS